MSETVTLTAILSIAGVILFWGYRRARPYGKLGILAWLQSVALMTPWLVFFALFALGVYLNFLVIVFLLVASAGVYILLGNQLRALGQDEFLRQKALERLKVQQSDEGNPQVMVSMLSPELLGISADDLEKIKGIFGIDTFFATETISYQQGAIFKGNLRGEPDKVHEQLTAKLQERLGEKYRLFLVEGMDERPVVVILPSTSDPVKASLAQKNLALVLLICTITTTLEASGLLLGFDWFSELGRYGEALPLSIGLWLVLIAHELGHWWMAKRYDVKLGLPFLIPSWQLGSFGAVTRFESLLPSRSSLFDIAFAGPVAGGVVSLILLITGFVLSDPSGVFKIPTQFFQGSILVGTLAKVFLGGQMQSDVISVHPLMVIGWLGLVITALNLLPIGQLDGGRMIQAIYGRKIAKNTGVISLILLGIIAFINPSNPVPLYWAIVILFLQRDPERPSLNEITEPDDTRAGLALFALFLMLSVLIPLSPALAGRLGIGG